MIGFFIKKAFFDGWDNLLHIVVLNVLILTVAFGGFFIAGFTAEIVPLSMALLFVTVMIEGVFLLAISSMMAKIVDYRSFTFRDFISEIGKIWKHGALFGALIAVLAFVFSVTLPYYLSLGNMIGFALAMLLFWVGIILLLSLQWFLPIRSQLDDNFMKCIKKSFIIFFDNSLFSIFMLIYSLVLFVLSLFLVMLVPGFTGILLAHNEAFRLRMYKYDWMEKNTDLDPVKARKSIPWEELLEDDEDTVGHRSFKSFIFPWKD
ncbi:MAG TPA: hypothetical protein VJ861_08225 [Treponemataceae bacterium]|nr:hypothetical protein [Treponemataceae bacterium]